MNVEPTTHPSAVELAGYSLGKLDEAATIAVAAHLETCPDCRQAAAQVPPDTFVGIIQTARAALPAVTPAPAMMPSRLGASPSLLSGARPQAEAELELPPELADHPRLRILRVLGRGGMGVVYLAEHRLMKQMRAVKVISKALLDHPEALPRFHREVQTAAQLDHRNIVRAYDAEQAGDLHMLVMEYVEGFDLAKVLERKGPLPVAHSCHYIRQAALGLQHAFEKQMVHRDIKPQNLLLVPEKGLVKVTDFGLARLVSERQQGKGLTAQNAVMGTVEYIAPEQATDARTADIRADIYSLGCTLYTLLTGRTPFQEETAVKMILAHLDQEAPPLHELRPEVSRELSTVVAKMMAKERVRRYPTPREVAEVLAGFCKPGGKAVTAEPISLQPTPQLSVGTLFKTDTDRVPQIRTRDAAQVPLAKPITEPTSLAQPAISPPTVPESSPWAQLTADTAMAPKVAKKPRGESSPKELRRRWPWLVAAGGAAFFILLGIIFSIQSKHGTIVIELSDPKANVEVKVDGEIIHLREGSHSLKLQAGEHHLRVEGKDFVTEARSFSVQRGINPVLQVTLVPYHERKLLPIEDAPKRVATSNSLGMLEQSKIPIVERFAWQPRELVAVWGEHRGRHWGSISAAVVSPDGKFIVSGGEDRAVRVWDPDTLSELAVLSGHNAPVRAVVVAHENRKIVSADAAGMIRLWNYSETWTSESVVRKGQNGAINSLAFSPASSRLASAGTGDYAISLWYMTKKDTLSPMHGKLIHHTDEVTALAFSPDGTHLASAGRDKTVALWRVTLAQPKIREVLRGHTDTISGLVFSPDGSKLYTSSHDKTIRVWNVTSPQARGEVMYQADAPIHSLTSSRDGTTLACGCTGAPGNTLVHLLEIGNSQPKQRAVIKGNREVAHTLAFGPDGKMLATGSAEGRLRLWNVANTPPVELVSPLGHAHSLRSLAFSPDGSRLVSGGLDLAARLWEADSSSKNEPQVLPSGWGKTLSAAFSPNGKTLALGETYSFLVSLWDMEAHPPKKRETLRGHSDWVTSVSISPDGKTLASCGGTVIRFWDLTKEKPDATDPFAGTGRKAPPAHLFTFSPDGKRGAGASWSNGQVWSWKREGNQLVQGVRLDGHQENVLALAYAPDSKTFASASRDGTVRIWEVDHDNSRLRHVLTSHTEAVFGLAYNPRDGSLITASDDGWVIIWDVVAGKKLREWHFPGPVRAVACAPDGRHLATGNGNGTIYVLRMRNDSKDLALDNMVLALDADFNRSRDGFPIGESPTLKYAYANEQWHLTITGGGLWWPGHQPLHKLQLDDFVCEVEAQFSKSDEQGGWGMGLTRNSGKTHPWTGVEMNGDGQFRINLYDHKKQEAVLPWTSYAATKHVTQTNTIRLEVKGNVMRLFVNGQFAAERTNKELLPAPRSITVYAFTSKPPVEVKFSRVRVWKPL